MPGSPCSRSPSLWLLGTFSFDGDASTRCSGARVSLSTTRASTISRESITTLDGAPRRGCRDPGYTMIICSGGERKLRECRVTHRLSCFSSGSIWGPVSRCSISWSTSGYRGLCLPFPSLLPRLSLVAIVTAHLEGYLVHGSHEHETGSTTLSALLVVYRQRAARSHATLLVDGGAAAKSAHCPLGDVTMF